MLLRVSLTPILEYGLSAFLMPPVGRFFGVRYFLHVSLNFTSTAKELSVRIPITIIDPNSLSLASNLIAEISNAIEETGRPPPPSAESSPRAPEKLSSKVAQRSDVDRIDHEPPSPPKAVQESWPWTPLREPRLSLIPSPLLPSIKSQDMRAAEVPRQGAGDSGVPIREDDTVKTKSNGRERADTSMVGKAPAPVIPPKDPVSSEDRRLSPMELAQADVSALRFMPEDTRIQTEQSAGNVEVDPEIIAGLTAEVEQSPRKVPLRKSRPRGIFFDRDLGRLTLPAEPPILPEAPASPNPKAPLVNSNFPHTDGEDASEWHKPLSSTLAEELSHENQALMHYYINTSPKQKRDRSVGRPISIKPRASKAHQRGRSRVIFIHAHPANRGRSMHPRNLESLDFGNESTILPHPPFHVKPEENADALWETVDEGGNFGGGPGPDLGDVSVLPSRRYESLLKVENWDSGSPPSGAYDNNNMF